jgi:hypothetical protein
MAKNILKNCLLVISLAGAFLLAGCGNKEQGDAGPNIDTAAIEQQFQNAPIDVKTDFDRALASVRKGELAIALAQFEALPKNAKLTPGQQQAVGEMIAKIHQADPKLKAQ